jgi:protein SCO1/2
MDRTAKRTVCALIAAAAFIDAAVCFAAPKAASSDSVMTDESAERRILQKIVFDQKLDAQLPLDLILTDEEGKQQPLRAYFGDRPVLFVLAYYRCPMLCNQVLNGVLKSTNALKFVAGRDFEIVVVSFDPSDTPAMAAAKRDSYVERYHHADGAAGWHFLTGSQETVAKIAETVGFTYVYDERSNQFAHASGIMIVTPDGRLSQYFYGIDFATRDLRLGLVEASEGKIGNFVDQVLLTCFHYDPLTGRYGVVILGLVRIAGVITVLAIVGYIALSLHRERRAKSQLALGPNQHS